MFAQAQGMTEVLVDSQFTCLTQSYRSRVLPLSPNFFSFVTVEIFWNLMVETLPLNGRILFERGSEILGD